MSSATALVASSSSTAAIAVAGGSTGQQAAGHFRGAAPVLQPGQALGQMGQLQPINAQQHPNTEDLLLTQNNVNNPAAVPIQQQQRPNWAVVTTSSTVSPIGEQILFITVIMYQATKPSRNMVKATTALVTYLLVVTQGQHKYAT